MHDASETGGPRITVTQGDIRAIQLAKSALYAGARLLMDKRGVDRVDRVVLAGAFGAHISPKHAMVLGMIPDAALAHVTSAGNAAGHGARIALCNRAARTRIEAVVKTIDKIETAIEPRFQEHFVNANAIPHATDPFPELAKITTLPQVAFGASGMAPGGAGGGGRRRQGAVPEVVRRHSGVPSRRCRPFGPSLSIFYGRPAVHLRHAPSGRSRGLAQIPEDSRRDLEGPHPRIVVMDHAGHHQLIRAEGIDKQAQGASRPSRLTRSPSMTARLFHLRHDGGR